MGSPERRLSVPGKEMAVVAIAFLGLAAACSSAGGFKDLPKFRANVLANPDRQCEVFNQPTPDLLFLSPDGELARNRTQALEVYRSG